MYVGGIPANIAVGVNKLGKKVDLLVLYLMINLVISLSISSMIEVLIQLRS